MGIFYSVFLRKECFFDNFRLIKVRVDRNEFIYLYLEKKNNQEVVRLLNCLCLNFKLMIFELELNCLMFKIKFFVCSKDVDLGVKDSYKEIMKVISKYGLQRVLIVNFKFVIQYVFILYCNYIFFLEVFLLFLLGD